MPRHDELVGISRSNLGHLWARSMHWELDNPAPGDVLPCEGLRIFGSIEIPLKPVEGIHTGEVATDGTRPAAYVLTGSLVSTRDYRVDMGSGPQHAGAEMVLSVNGSTRSGASPWSGGEGCRRQRSLDCARRDLAHRRLRVGRLRVSRYSPLVVRRAGPVPWIGRLPTPAPPDAMTSDCPGRACTADKHSHAANSARSHRRGSLNSGGRRNDGLFGVR